MPAHINHLRLSRFAHFRKEEQKVWCIRKTKEGTLVVLPREPSTPPPHLVQRAGQPVPSTDGSQAAEDVPTITVTGPGPMQGMDIPSFQERQPPSDSWMDDHPAYILEGIPETSSHLRLLEGAVFTKMEDTINEEIAWETIGAAPLVAS